MDVLHEASTSQLRLPIQLSVLLGKTVEGEELLAALPPGHLVPAGPTQIPPAPAPRARGRRIIELCLKQHARILRQRRRRRIFNSVGNAFRYLRG